MCKEFQHLQVDGAIYGIDLSVTMPSLTVEAKDSGLISVPYTILEAIFDKAKSLLCKVWQILGMDNMWMVSSLQKPTAPHKATLANKQICKLVCDKYGVNYSAHSVCSHTVAIVEETKVLSRFSKISQK